MELGRYRMEKKLGAGGMGEVFLARASGVAGFEKPVALKRIYRHISEDENYRRLFVREAKVSARLSHPNIVQVFDLGEEEGELFIAMELVDGPSLADILEHLDRRDATLSPEAAAVVAFDVLEALIYAQTVPGDDGEPLRLVHRDISPHNILVQRAGGFAKLCDFGVAKGHGVAQATLGKAVGKSSYMAPEQAMGRDIDGRADIYSLGAVLYEAVAGEPPQEAANLLALVDVLLHQEAPRLGETNPNLPLPFVDLVDRALKRKRDERYASAVEFRDGVERFLASRDPRAAREELRQLACELEDTVVAKVELPTERAGVRGTDRWRTLIDEDELTSDGGFGEDSDYPPEYFDTVPDMQLMAEQQRASIELFGKRVPLRMAALGIAVLAGLVLVIVLASSSDDDASDPPAVVSGPDVEDVRVVTATEPPVEEPAAEPDTEVSEPKVESETPGSTEAKRKVTKSRAPGYLNLNVRPWARVVIDGVEISKPTPLRRFPLAPGRHTVVLHGPRGRSRTVTVTIRSGRTVTRILSFD